MSLHARIQMLAADPKPKAPVSTDPDRKATFAAEHTAEQLKTKYAQHRALSAHFGYVSDIMDLMGDKAAGERYAKLETKHRVAADKLQTKISKSNQK